MTSSLPNPSSKLFPQQLWLRSQPTLLEDKAPGESETWPWLGTRPESRSPDCVVGVELPALSLRPLKTLPPRRQVLPSPHLHTPHSLTSVRTPPVHRA
jgi:hypothetical protein